jgi:hypothetical protein
MVNRVVNLMLLAPGTKISLSNGAEAEVVANPRDGVWVFARYVSSPREPSLVGTEEMVFAQDIVEVLQTP